MKKFIRYSVFIFLIILTGFPAIAQDKGKLTNQEIDKYKIQVTNLVKYLEGTMNFLGDPKEVYKEKEIIIDDSYLKMFKNDKVQIEDDLDDKREVPLHKDVQAYLKDIGFFFKQVKFQFVIADISYFDNGNGLGYFRVTINRSLDGVTVQGDTVNSKKIRYIEINLDDKDNDMKIASIYTTKLDEREEARNWWNGLTAEWKQILGGTTMITDSLKLADVAFFDDKMVIRAKMNGKSDSIAAADYKSDMPQQSSTVSNTASDYDTLYFDTEIINLMLSSIRKQQAIDVSGNQQIRNLDPLNEMSELSEINCSGTVISSIFPIRNLNHLESLNFSNTPVEDISPLHFASSLKELDCSFTLITDLSPISDLSNLEKLNCSGLRISSIYFAESLLKLNSFDCSETSVQDIEPVGEMKLLTSLDLSGNFISDISAIANNTKLEYLNCENTSVNNLDPLKNLSSLKILRISNTGVETIKSLAELTNLQKIYCDNTKISKAEALGFMKNHPGCIVIFESEELINGWKQLEQPWREIVKANTGIGDNPTKEELHSLLNIEKLDISGNKQITTLNPLKRLYNLKDLNVSGINVKDFSPIGEDVDLEILNISNTQVNDLGFCQTLGRLKELNISRTSVGSITPLENLADLKIIYADSSAISDEAAFSFRLKNPKCMIIYKTHKLTEWWQNLPEAWQNYFTVQFKVYSPPTKIQLHEILFLDSLVINNNNKIKDLSPLTMLRGLQILRISSTQISNLQPIAELHSLKTIQCTQSPVTDLNPLTGLTQLEHVNIENTPVDELDALSGLTNLKSLNFSGTQVSSLKPIETLTKLEEIEMNNTSIKTLKNLSDLPSLKLVKCFNTRISAKTVAKFKESKPGCEVVYY